MITRDGIESLSGFSFEFILMFFLNFSKFGKFRQIKNSGRTAWKWGLGPDFWPFSKFGAQKWAWEVRLKCIFLSISSFLDRICVDFVSFYVTLCWEALPARRCAAGWPSPGGQQRAELLSSQFRPVLTVNTRPYPSHWEWVGTIGPTHYLRCFLPKWLNFTKLSTQSAPMAQF